MEAKRLTKEQAEFLNKVLFQEAIKFDYISKEFDFGEIEEGDMCKFEDADKVLYEFQKHRRKCMSLLDKLDAAIYDPRVADPDCKPSKNPPITKLTNIQVGDDEIERQLSEMNAKMMAILNEKLETEQPILEVLGAFRWLLCNSLAAHGFFEMPDFGKFELNKETGAITLALSDKWKTRMAESAARQ